MAKKAVGRLAVVGLLAVGVGAAAVFAFRGVRDAIVNADVPVQNRAAGVGVQLANGQDPIPQIKNPVQITPREGVSFINENFGNIQERQVPFERLPDGFEVRVKGVTGSFRSGALTTQTNFDTGGTRDVFLGVRSAGTGADGLTTFERVERDSLRAKLQRGEPLTAFQKSRAADLLGVSVA